MWTAGVKIVVKWNFLGGFGSASVVASMVMQEDGGCLRL